MIRTGAHLVFEALEAAGIDMVFGYPGGGVIALYDALLDHPSIQHVLTRHEQGAIHMADGYARATGKVGACMVTTGPGATNLITGLMVALHDSSPIVAITGQVAQHTIGTGAFQEVDIVSVAKPVTKAARWVAESEDVAEAMKWAIETARSGRPGPVLLAIGKEAMTNLVDAAVPSFAPAASQPVDSFLISECANLISAAKRPVIIAGAGVVRSQTAEAVRSIAHRQDIPVGTSLLGMCAFDRKDPLSLGIVGMHGDERAHRAILECDLLIALGIRFDERLTGELATFAPNAKIIHFDFDPAEDGRRIRPEKFVLGDLAETLPALSDTLPSKLRKEWREQLVAPIPAPSTPNLSAADVVRALGAVVSDNAILVTDVGQHQMCVAQLFAFRPGLTLLTSGGFGSMGFGLPAAIGACLADPSREVWAVVGDGGFQMTLQEMAVARDLNLPLRLILIDNGGLGMVRQAQGAVSPDRLSQVTMKGPHYSHVAAAYDWSYSECADHARRGSSLASLLTHTGPTLGVFRVCQSDLVMTSAAVEMPAEVETTAL